MGQRRWCLGGGAGAPLLHGAGSWSFFLCSLLSSGGGDRRARQLLRRLDERVRAAPRRADRLLRLRVARGGAAGCSISASLFHWRLSVARGGAARCSTGGLFPGCLSVRGARRWGRLPEGSTGPAHASAREFVQSWLTAGRSTKVPAGSGAGQSMGGLMPQIPHSCPTATEDASRAVAGHVARCRWTARSNLFGRWHIRGRGWDAATREEGLLAEVLLVHLRDLRGRRAFTRRPRRRVDGVPLRCGRGVSNEY